MKKTFVSLSQLALGVGIVCCLIYRLNRRGDMDKLWAALRAAASNWPLLVLAVCTFGVCIFLCTVRWSLLLRAQGLDMPFRRVFALYFIGHFFNAFMLGATGGDLVKAYYVARETKHKKAEIVATVFMDRIVGLFALIVLAMAILGLRLRFFLSEPILRGVLAFNLLAFGGATVGIASLLLRNVFLKRAFFRRLEERSRLCAIAGRVYATFHGSISSTSLFVRTFSLSLLNHLAGIVMIFYLGMAIGLRLPFLDYLTVFPSINAIATMPLTPGGLGTREAAAIHILRVFDVPEAKAFTLSLFIYFTVMLWSLFGGAVYLFYAWRRGAPPATEVMAESRSKAQLSP